ncbi:MAG TPA: hypothetical protein PLP27_09770 [Crocinitomicaceae bacterium]|nr:hypothetical protein [Crocinitomicaceae bacterium]
MTEHRVWKHTGTWSFIGTNKTDEFKKNERIVFNFLNISFTNATTINSTTTTSSGTESYKVGELSMIYTVKESTGKKLVLFSETENVNSNTSGSSTSTSSSKGTYEITLEK